MNNMAQWTNSFLVEAYNKMNDHNYAKYGHESHCNIMWPAAECVCDCKARFEEGYQKESKED